MIDRATGIILRTRPLTDTSLIVHWLTREFGRLATVAKGARRATSPFRGRLDLFYLADFSFQRSRRSDLHPLREVAVRESHLALRQEPGCLQQAAYGAALLELTTETETPIPALFDLLHKFLGELQLSPPVPRTVFAFEVKLLVELGLRPDLPKAKLSAGSRRLLESLGATPWPKLRQLKPSATQTDEIERFLGGFIEFHLERVPAVRKDAVRLGSWGA